MAEPYDAIVAGAGPIGLFIACELARAKASVLVLERDTDPHSPWKGERLGLRGLNTASTEAFYRRGLLDKVVGSDVKPSDILKMPAGFKFGGHFAGLLLDREKFDISRWKYRIPGHGLDPCTTYMAKVEAALTGHAESLGATILRGKGVTGVSQDDNGITVEAGGETYRTKWLVGCDGGRSTVRKAAGFAFEGSEPECTGYGIKLEFDDPDKLHDWFTVTKTGMYVRAGSKDRIHLLDFDGGAFHRSGEITIEHIQKVLARVTETDAKVVKLETATTFTDRCKQATTYRKGRILLAGDAAHIHSPLGAQGLNLGLGDAINLGWKLAATIQASKTNPGPVDFTLLDTYEKERHPIGNGVLEWSRAQVATLKPGLTALALRKLITSVIDTKDGTNLFVDRVWGLSQRYEIGDMKHDLLGYSAPDFEFNDGARLGSKLEGGQGLLVDFSNNATLKELVDKYKSVDYVGVRAKDELGLRALLVRPDGVVAWVTDGEPDVEAAKTALQTWFGITS
ncbi:monooxygenase [Hypoxylon trugodes]|uniref:monooxygenase n=1 Tax=Hypoxylon trugodes TaxID=326681 RepID=UPI00218DD87A|nr:monooxygenase [Hypoxylon trugodes]KAI1383535.1 monooxygenase [Hypoxylon trugodes]